MSTLLVEIRCSYSSNSAFVRAIRNKKGGYSISWVQLLRAKRNMGIPEWATVFILPSVNCSTLSVIGDRPEHDEVISCAN